MDRELSHINQDLSDAVKKRREELGLTQAEVANRAGIGQPYISKIERGIIKSPSSSTIEALAKALEMDVDTLWWTMSAEPDDGEVGYCPKFECPGSNYYEDIDPLSWEPYKTSLEDEEGRIAFCVHCGTSLLAECQNCGRKMRRFYHYCPGCGHHLIPNRVHTSQEEEDDVPF